MATPVIMPRQGQSVESCIITKWRKKPGDKVEAGEVLFEYETDKAAFEEEAKLSGTLLAVFFEEDDDVPCLTNVAVIGDEGEDPSAFAPGGTGSPSKEEPAAPVRDEKKNEPVAAAPAAVAKTPETKFTGISPRARAEAERLHVNASDAVPSGPHGRIIDRDVVELASSLRTGSGIGGRVLPGDVNVSVSAPGNVEYEDVKLSNIRKVIARSMHESLSSMAQLTHNSSFDASEVLNYRKWLKTSAKEFGLPNITVTDIIIYAASRVLLRHPDLNAHFLGDSIRHFRHVHIGIAVDTPRGLMVPTLFNADTKGLAQIAAESKELAKAAQSGSIDPGLLQGASFTISNLGNFGVEHFTPVINPPQTGILGVDCIIERPRTGKNGIELYPAMGLSLTYDHRAVDGAPASRFLMDMRSALEDLNGLFNEQE